MFLSALTLAALLQATPVAGQKGYLLQREPFEAGQRVDQPRLPFHRKVRPATDEVASRFADPLKPSPSTTAPRRRVVVRDTLMATCGRYGLEKAVVAETLKAQPLSKMPEAHGERAVARLVDGCPVAVPVVQRTPAP